MTRNASSTSVILTPTNPLYSHEGIAYIKAYNLNKDIFATPLKTYNTFNNHYFKAIGFSQKYLNR